MQRWTPSMIGLLALAGIGLTAVDVTADFDLLRHVSVAFGRGLNTAQQGNVVNHVVIPDRIWVKQDGVVHFLVSGFHQLVVYKPGIEQDDIVVPPAGTFIEDPMSLDPATQFYLGIVPAGGPPPGLPVTTNPSNASNRVESVSFAEPGTYLVICNVRGHFRDGMYAYIRVLP